MMKWVGVMKSWGRSSLWSTQIGNLQEKKSAILLLLSWEWQWENCKWGSKKRCGVLPLDFCYHGKSITCVSRGQAWLVCWERAKSVGRVVRRGRSVWTTGYLKKEQWRLPQVVCYRGGLRLWDWVLENWSKRRSFSGLPGCWQAWPGAMALNLWSPSLCQSDDHTYGVHITYLVYQRFTVWFITIATL